MPSLMHLTPRQTHSLVYSPRPHWKGGKPGFVNKLIFYIISLPKSGGTVGHRSSLACSVACSVACVLGTQHFHSWWRHTCSSPIWNVISSGIGFKIGRQYKLSLARVLMRRSRDWKPAAVIRSSTTRARWKPPPTHPHPRLPRLPSHFLSVPSTPLSKIKVQFEQGGEETIPSFFSG